MLQAFGLTYSPDPRVGPIFEDLDLSLAAGEKIALVGRNGAGKSLLLRLLAGRLIPDRGRVVRQGGARVAYLAQDFAHDFEGTLLELLEEESPEAPPHLVAKAVNRLGLSPEMLHRPYVTLSPGERMRGALAALIATEPDVLLLDEPTNHLDVSAKEWLEEFLIESPEAVLIVSHDRAVIDAVAKRVVELERGRLTSYTGDYSEMVGAKSTRDAKQKEAWQRHREEDRRLRIAAERVAQAASAVTKRPTQQTYSPGSKPFYAAKQARMDRTAKAMLSRVQHARSDAPEKPFEPDHVRLDFPATPLRSPEALAVRNLRMSFGPRVLFDGLHLTLERGGRLAVLGPNGAGKTTLFRLLLRELSPDAGEIVWAPDARIATLSQARDALDLSLPALRALDLIDADAEQFARNALGLLGIRGEMAEHPVGALSVGERTKVEIVAMLLTRANVLMMDEPTNHLDVASLEALETALVDFPGAVIFTSHDRAFVERVATETIALGEEAV